MKITFGITIAALILFPVVWAQTDSPGSAAFKLEFGGSYLRLRQAVNAVSPGQTPANPLQRMVAANGFQYLTLAVPDRAAVGERLTQAGFPKLLEFGVASTTYDPDGMVVEIIPASAGGEHLMLGIIAADGVASRDFLVKQMGFIHERSRPMPPALGSGEVHHLAVGKTTLKVADPEAERPAAAEKGQGGVRGLTVLVPDPAVVQTELSRRGLAAKAGTGASLVLADPDGNEIRVASLASVPGVTAAGDPSPATDGFRPRVVTMGDSSFIYIDPEYDQENRRMVFQDLQRSIWIGQIDGSTGDFKTETGRDLLVAEGTVSAREAANGPEFARDRNGWSVIYTKKDGSGVPQTWRTRLEESGPVMEQLTHLPKGSAGALVTLDAALDRTWFAYLQREGRDLTAFVAHSLAPDQPVLIPDYQIGNGGARFVPGAAEMLYARNNSETGRNEVMRRYLETGRVVRLLGEAQVQRYYDAWIFPAPEVGGKETLVTTIDRTRIAFYRKPDDDGDTDWRRVAELTLPDGFPHRLIYSMEPVVGIDGKVDRSWVFFEAKAGPAQGSENSVWVASPGIDGRKPIVRRVDDGAETGIAASRTEPETLVGDREVFLYYSYRPLSGGRGGLRRAATGITWTNSKPTMDSKP